MDLALIPVSELRKWDVFRNLDVVLVQSVRFAYVTEQGKTGYIITSNDTIYVVRQLDALGRSFSQFSTPVKLDALCGRKVADLKSGGDDPRFRFTVALTSNGLVYTWGSANYNGEYLFLIPATFEAFQNKKIKQVVCGNNHILALTDNGEVYSWGSTYLGKLGIDVLWLIPTTLQVIEIVYIPQQITALSQILVTSISVGSNHSCALTDSGEVYMWGSNVHGQLGIDDKTVINSNTPVPVPLLKFRKVLCGETHVIGLSTERKVYCWGSNEKEQLGFKDYAKNQYSPRKHDLPPVDDIALNSLGNFSACRTMSGDFFIWGDVSKHNGLQSCVSCPLQVNCNSFMELLSFYHYYPQMHEPLTGFNARKNIRTRLEMDFILAGNGNSQTDVVFDVQGRQIRAHMSVLRQSGRYFAALLANYNETTHNNVISILEGIRYEPFFALVYFIYSNDLMFPEQPVTLKDLYDLLLLADADISPKIKPVIEKVLQKTITVDNVVAMFNLFSAYIESVHYLTMGFMVKNLRAIANTGTLGELRHGVLAELVTKFLK